jgi:tetratricopeptide (TPR) repeat protein
MGNKAGEAKTIYSIGEIYQDTNRFQEALQNYKQSLKIVREIGDETGVNINMMAIKALEEKMDKTQMTE